MSNKDIFDEQLMARKKEIEEETKERVKRKKEKMDRGGVPIEKRPI